MSLSFLNNRENNEVFHKKFLNSLIKIPSLLLNVNLRKKKVKHYVKLCKFR